MRPVFYFLYTVRFFSVFFAGHRVWVVSQYRVSEPGIITLYCCTLLYDVRVCILDTCHVLLLLLPRCCCPAVAEVLLLLFVIICMPDDVL